MHAPGPLDVSRAGFEGELEAAPGAVAMEARSHADAGIRLRFEHVETVLPGSGRRGGTAGRLDGRPPAVA